MENDFEAFSIHQPVQPPLKVRELPVCMKANSLMCLSLVAALAMSCGAQVETSFHLVAMDGQPASGIATNVFFGGINSFSLANDGRVAFTANIYGPGVTSTNNEGVWMEFAGDLNLMGRTGDPVPGTNGFGYFTFLGDPNISDSQAVAFGAETSTSTNDDPTADEFTVLGYFKVFGALICAFEGNTAVLIHYWKNLSLKSIRTPPRSSNSPDRALVQLTIWQSWLALPLT